ncbi:hypothetical protein BC940DRAFT_36638 [Gongronella butleri]|nr:hypothetical protein BC940DRAFT_36638 [Gongronella butleri]
MTFTLEELAQRSAMGKKSVVKHVASLGHAEGEKRSGERLQQAETLWRFGSPELRGLHADKDAIVHWLTSLEQGRDIFHCALQAHQAARFEATETHTAQQLNAISRLGPLIGLEKGDHSFLDDSELVKAATPAKGKQMTAIHKERLRAAPTTIKGMDAIEMFLDTPVRVIGENGMARAMPNGIPWPSSVPQGQYRLHVDPQVDRRAVLLKRTDSDEYVLDARREIIKIKDVTLERIGHDTSFFAFKKTIELLDIPLHNSLHGTWDKMCVACLFAEKYLDRASNKFKAAFPHQKQLSPWPRHEFPCGAQDNHGYNRHGPARDGVLGEPTRSPTLHARPKRC